MDGRTCADGVGRRTGGHEGAWMHRRVRMVWVQGKGWEMGGEKGPVGTSVDARMCAEGVGGRDVRHDWGEGPVGMSERGCGEMCGQFVQGKGEMGGEKDRWA